MSILDKIKIKKTTASDQPEAVKDSSTESIVNSASKELISADTKKKSATKNKAVNKDKTGNAYLSGILLSPIMTEKSVSAEKHNKYSFVVTVEATKNEIKKAVIARYGVSPIKVNVVNNEGKFKRYGKSFGQRKDSRKAIVTLPAGKSINVYDTK